MSQIRIAPEAQADLSDIWAHIARSSRPAADRVTARIVARFATPARFPEMGASCEEVSPGLRYLAVGRYVILYGPSTTVSKSSASSTTPATFPPCSRRKGTLPSNSFGTPVSVWHDISPAAAGRVVRAPARGARGGAFPGGVMVKEGWPYRMLGKHRRVLTDALVAYRERCSAWRRARPTRWPRCRKTSGCLTSTDRPASYSEAPCSPWSRSTKRAFCT
jgi:toxin ParE1/3/4